MANYSFLDFHLEDKKDEQGLGAGFFYLAKAAEFADKFNPKMIIQEKSVVNKTVVDLINTLPSHPGVLPENPVAVKDWHQSCSKDIRYLIVQRIAQAIINRDIFMMEEQTLRKLIDYSRRIEACIYGAVNSPEEFQMRLLAHMQKVKIKSKLGEKKQLQVCHIIAPVIINPSVGVKIQLEVNATVKKILDKGALVKRNLNEKEGSFDALPAKRKSEDEGARGFDRALEPDIVIKSAKDSSGELKYLIKWKGCDEADWVSSKTANLKYPQIVIKFYENKSA